MGCGGSKPFVAIDESSARVIEVLSNRPSNEHLIHKFRGNAQQLKNIEDAYKSTVFGGSIFLPIGSSRKQGEKRDKTNNLKKEIEDAHIDYLYGGGYYVLQNVKVSRETDGTNDEEANLYIDIYMLIQSIDDIQELKKLKITREQAEPVRFDKNKKEIVAPKPVAKRVTAREQIYFDDIGQALTGYGRIIYYRSNGDINNPMDNSIEFVHEGKFRQGEMDGYCRSFDAIDEGHVEVGFFKDGRSLGKYQEFKINGELISQGIKDGDDVIKQVEIADFMTRNLQSDLVQLEKSANTDKNKLYKTNLAKAQTSPKRAK